MSQASAIPAAILVLALAGCVVTPAPLPPQTESQTSARASGSDLIYATTIGGRGFVFAYPSGGIVSKFGVPKAKDVWGLCADGNGNVFVTAERSARSSLVYEYAHGGTAPVATLRDDGYVAGGCSSDPVSGDLAVTSYSLSSSAKNNVALYSPGRSRPRRFFDAELSAAFCAFDGAGNLFVDGEGSVQLAELRKGGSSLETITLDRVLVRPGGLEWDGSDLAIEEGGFARKFSAIDRVRLTGSNGKVARAIHLHGLANRGATFAIDARAVVSAGGQQDTEIGEWFYPSGGRVRKIFRARDIRGDSLYGVSISLAAGCERKEAAHCAASVGWFLKRVSTL